MIVPKKMVYVYGFLKVSSGVVQIKYLDFSLKNSSPGVKYVKTTSSCFTLSCKTIKFELKHSKDCL